jgi:hypothetical protein
MRWKQREALVAAMTRSDPQALLDLGTSLDLPASESAHRDQRRRLRLALAEFLHEAMRLLAWVRC